MPSLLIVAHAPLATSLLAVARHVYPDCNRTAAAVDVPEDAPPEAVQQQIRQALAKLTVATSQVLVLADVYGATPCNAALAVADGVDVRLVAGVNVSMLWRALQYVEMPLDALVDRALAGAAQGVLEVSRKDR